MAGYRIVSVITEEPHGHVIVIGTGGADRGADWHWPIEEVHRALASGESFYAVSPERGERIEVEAAECPVEGCAAITIHADGNGGERDVLDRLVTCQRS